ncbi:MAG: L,D-transpeptidase family protein [Bacteroidales bacterium]|nr:L,D-transpeptidase family protein [Bacteroidales bacterium]
MTKGFFKGEVPRHILIISAIAGLITLVGFLLFYPVPSPPVSKMEHARKTLSNARKEGADTYSTTLFTEAIEYYDSAMTNWRSENMRFIYSRDYNKVSFYAGLSSDKAELAAEDSKNTLSELETRLKQKIGALNVLITEINELFTSYPLAYEVRNRISKGKMLLKESEIAFNNRQYLQADRKMTDAETLLTTSFENASSNLKSYFKSYPEWRKWINQTIAESRQDSGYSIIIDKFSRKCVIYFNGIKKYQYNAELGRNWVGDKRVSGDKATPEGMYKIIRKFKSDSTKYYKALLLDYPNNEDTAKFISDIAKGILPVSAKIGGMIEIHGNGGKGVDWTEGCIALTDREMDTVFKIIEIGTPVTIVGSMYNLQHVLNR